MIYALIAAGVLILVAFTAAGFYFGRMVGQDDAYPGAHVGRPRGPMPPPLNSRLQERYYAAVPSWVTSAPPEMTA